MKTEKKIKKYALMFLLGAIIIQLTFSNLMNFYNKWGMVILTSLIISAIVELILIRFGLGFSKKLSIKIWGIKITAFAVLAFIVEKLFFS